MKNTKDRIKLPIDAQMPQILKSVSNHSTVLLQAEPGSGKTTRVPQALLDTLPKKVLVLEPRRLAAKLSAERIAQELGEKCGETVGFQTRFLRRTSPQTRLFVITDGLFLHLLRQDPTLSEYSAIVLDEFHERNMNIDLALMLIRRLQETERPDLKLIIMSATLATKELIEYCPDHALYSSTGRTFPIQIFHLPLEGHQDRDIADATLRLSKDPTCNGNILVFSVGVGQILRIKNLLMNALSKEWLVLPLYADLNPKEQEKVFIKQNKRLVVLATNVAETSLTLPGITGVVDPGLAKIAGYAPWSGMPVLEIEKISRASAEQRAGRAGRTEEGTVYRLYPKHEFFKRKPQTVPDIQALDLCQVVLEVLNLQTENVIETHDSILDLPWFQPPEESRLDAAFRTLRYLRAIDCDGNLTSLGRRIGSIPLHPRLAAIVIAGQDHSIPEHALLAACILSEGVTSKQDRTIHGPCDIMHQMEQFQEQGFLERDPSVNRRMSSAKQLYANLAKRLKMPTKPPNTEADRKLLSLCLLAGYPDRVAKRRKVPARGKRLAKTDLYNFCQGRGGKLSPTSVLKPTDFIIALEATEQHGKDASVGTSIRVASTINLVDLQENPGNFVSVLTDQRNPSQSKETETWSVTKYGEIVLSEERVSKTDDWTSESIALWLQNNWIPPFQDRDEFEIYHIKAELLAKYSLGNLPEFKGEMLELACLEMADGCQTLDEVLAIPLMTHIQNQLSYQDQEILRSLTPNALKMENGKKISIHYESQKSPKIRGYIQDFYGIKCYPTVLDSRCPLVFEILAPNKRVIQMTSDLEGFWQRNYPDLAKEYRRRYPRHHWPEDPKDAQAVLLKRQLAKP